jgi:hypothetical protein
LALLVAIVFGAHPVAAQVDGDCDLAGVVGYSAAQAWQPVPPNPSAQAIWQYNNPGGHVEPTQCNDGRRFWVKATVDTDIY